MEIKSLLVNYIKSPKTKAAIETLTEKEESVFLKGLAGSCCSLVLSAICSNLGRNILIIEDDEDSAGYLYNDLCQLPKSERVYYFPSGYRKSFKYGKTDSSNIILRTEVLNALQKHSNNIIITYPEALLEKIVKPKELSSKTLTLKKGDTINNETICKLLNSFGYEMVDYVYEPGHYAIRGSIIDVYSWNNDLPYRIDFFGDEIETIRTFDVESQLSVENTEAISLLPSAANLEGAPVIFTEHLGENAIYAFRDYSYAAEKVNDFKNNSEKELQTITKAEFEENCSRHIWIEYGNKTYSNKNSVFAFDTAPQDIFNKNFDIVSDTFKKYISRQFQLYVLSDNEKQTERLKQIFEDRGDDINFIPINKTLHEGFIDNEFKTACFTDHQIFERYHKYNIGNENVKNNKLALTLKEILQFQFGDYVVHMDYGVGRFGGMFKTEINGKIQEVIKIMYKDNDTLFVNIHNLHKISKYKGKEGSEPTINKLGSSSWSRAKEKAKKKVKDIARDLILLYAKRKEEKGIAFSPDTYLQQELEASFPYEDTPDQRKVSEDVKNDMENSRPMDRLICGDVGFGKTEIAIRAAFKAVTDSKQVAVLVPTTVLAFQHFKTFSKRLDKFPCNIEYLSRSRSSAKTSEIQKKLKDGEIDIIIGTQKILGKSIQFRDLGLLIIDEEQKFGVSVKEKLRQLKVNIDTLTLSATPIPRTLQFSLMGARDLSIISTPPPNRHPILTEVYTFNEDLIKEAIEYELNRNGQVYIINNRVQNLPEIEAMVHRCVPGVRTVIGHGQLPGQELEKRIIDFMDYAYDVIICTTIVENGIDIPNANTIIVNNAQTFGLSELHQLRGRVGRSNKNALCYLLAPPLNTLTQDARRRLKAIENFSELGSGFNIAMQDLDIRGAGNLLGSEQSGFIADLGYETYQKILEEAVQELKADEFSDLYADEKTKSKDGNFYYVSDCTVETDMELMFPDNYIPGAAERINLYREMDNLETEEEIKNYSAKLEDRFGPVPRIVKDLLNIVRMRRFAKRSGIERIIIKNSRMICYFVSNPESAFYKSSAFDNIINYTQNNLRNTVLKERNGKRSLIIKNIENIETALVQLKLMQ